MLFDGREVFQKDLRRLTVTILSLMQNATRYHGLRVQHQGTSAVGRAVGEVCGLEE